MGTIFFCLILLQGQIPQQTEFASYAGTRAHVYATLPVRVANQTPIVVTHHLKDGPKQVMFVENMNSDELGAMCSLEYDRTVTVLADDGTYVFVRYSTDPARRNYGICPDGVVTYLDRRLYATMEARWHDEEARLNLQRSGLRPVIVLTNPGAGPAPIRLVPIAPRVYP